MANTLSETALAEVKRLVEKAAPHRVEILEVLNKKMTYLRQSFVLHFVKNINKKKDKEEYIETKVAQEKIFRKIKDYIHYEGGSSPIPRLDGLNKIDKLLEEVSTAIQYLRYIEHTENLDACLARLGMTITVRDLTSIYPDLSNEAVHDNIKKIFGSASSIQSQICNEANAIKVNIFDELDDSIKYDAKYNKSGLKANEFDKLTTLEAFKQKSEELAEKKLDALKDSVGNTIDSKLNVQAAAQMVVE